MIPSTNSVSACRLQAEFSPVFGRTAPGESASGANLWSLEVNCRPPSGSQKCDTVNEFNAGVQIATRIQSSVWTDSSERERDSGANLWSPEVSCRPPMASQNVILSTNSTSACRSHAEFTPVFGWTAPSESVILARIFGHPK